MESKKILSFSKAVLDLAVVFGVAFLVNTYVASAIQVDGISMCNTFNFSDGKCREGKGERIFVDKIGFQNIFGNTLEKLKRGDIIVFHPPEKAKLFYVKRIIGLPGETVELKKGKVYIYNNDHSAGFELIEPYLNKENKNKTYLPSQKETENGVKFLVPQNHFFVLGDNRRRSLDSRFCFKQNSPSLKCDDPNEISHFVESKKIEGKALATLWPLDKIKFLP